MRILKSHPLLKMVNSYVIDSPQPSNISYLWNFGSLLVLCLIIQIITGVTLGMHYTPNVLEAFDSVEHIMRDVNNGWLIRYLHSNITSAFFFLVYLHKKRDLYHGSYKAPKTLTWTIGTVIFILMMSLWGATVITNLMHALLRLNIEQNLINLCVNVIHIFSFFYFFKSLYALFSKKSRIYKNLKNVSLEKILKNLYGRSYKKTKFYKNIKNIEIKKSYFFTKYVYFIQGLKDFSKGSKLCCAFFETVLAFFPKVRFYCRTNFFFPIFLANLIWFTIGLKIYLFFVPNCYFLIFLYSIFIFITIVYILLTIGLNITLILIGFVLNKTIRFIFYIFFIIQDSLIVNEFSYIISLSYFNSRKKDKFNIIRFFITFFIFIIFILYTIMLLMNIYVIIKNNPFLMENGLVNMSGRGRGELPNNSNFNEGGPSNPNKRPNTDPDNTGAAPEDDSSRKRLRSSRSSDNTNLASYNPSRYIVGSRYWGEEAYTSLLENLIPDSNPPSSIIKQEEVKDLTLNRIPAHVTNLSSEKEISNVYNINPETAIWSRSDNIPSSSITGTQSNTSTSNITSNYITGLQSNSGLRNPFHSYYSSPYNSLTTSENIPSTYTRPILYNTTNPRLNPIDPQLIYPQLSHNTGTSVNYDPSIYNRPVHSNPGVPNVNPKNTDLSINTTSNAGFVRSTPITSSMLTQYNSNTSFTNQATVNLLSTSSANTSYTDQEIRTLVSRINIPKNALLDKPIFCHSVWFNKNVLWFVGDFNKSNLEAICKNTDLSGCNIIEWSSNPKKLGIDLENVAYTYMQRENRRGLAVPDIGLWKDYILTNKSNKIEILQGNRVFIETYTKHRS